MRPGFSSTRYITLADLTHLQSLLGRYIFLPREAMGDSNDRGWFLGINHGHVT